MISFSLTNFVLCFPLSFTFEEKLKQETRAVQMAEIQIKSAVECSYKRKE